MGKGNSLLRRLTTEREEVKMNNIAQGRKEIYELKQLLTVEKLRAFRRECAVDDLDKQLTRVEKLITGKGENYAQSN